MLISDKMLLLNHECQLICESKEMCFLLSPELPKALGSPLDCDHLAIGHFFVTDTMNYPGCHVEEGCGD